MSMLSCAHQISSAHRGISLPLDRDGTKAMAKFRVVVPAEMLAKKAALVEA